MMTDNQFHNMLLPAIFAYGLTIVALCWFFRPQEGYVDFIVGNKSSGWLITAFGLFTLIGGGELVAGAALGYVFGWAGVLLFVGYGISFVLLAILSPRLLGDAAPGTASYVDYAHQKFGNTVGAIVLLGHISAFFALLVLQLSAGGHVISSLSSLSYMESVLLCAFLICLYLLVGGYRAVMVTDVVQGLVMALLIAVAAYATFGAHLPEPQGPGMQGFASPGLDMSWGILFSGLIIGLASADVWQRVFAARSSSAAQGGFVAGGILLAIYGGLIVYFGILSRGYGLTEDPDAAYMSVLRSALPVSLLVAASFATLAAVLSTADTEIFLIGSLLERGYRQWMTNAPPWIPGDGHKSLGTRCFIVAVVACACVAAYWGDDLAVLFNWMFVSYMILAPTIAASVLVPSLGRLAFLASFASSGAMFVGLLSQELLSLSNSYVLAVPAIAVALYSMIKNQEG